MAEINPIVVDLSHWDPAYDYEAVLKEGVHGCIYKATEGDNYTDPTYVQQQMVAKEAGLCWGAYHFATADLINEQIDNFLEYAAPDPDELFCLDWEDYGSNTMSLADVKTWIREVENALGREGQCVLYSGNTAKEALGDNVDTFLGDRRLWLCQYGDSPTWQQSWDKPWLWQYTDGIYGPTPHEIDGIGPCDINSFDGSSDELRVEWASGDAVPMPRPPIPPTPPSHGQVTILVAAPPGITIKVRRLRLGKSVLNRRPNRRAKEAR